MEAPTYVENLKNFRSVLALQRVVGDADPADQTVVELKRVCTGYATELRYRLGLATPFADDIDRLARSKETMRAMNPVYDWIAEVYEDPDTRPVLIHGILRFFALMSLDLQRVITLVEGSHPDLKWLFDKERADYLRIHEQWRREDEAEAL